MPPAVASAPWRHRRHLVFQSVFQTNVSQPTPQITPCVRFPDVGQPFSGHGHGHLGNHGHGVSAGRSAEPPSGFRAQSGPVFSQPATQEHGLAHPPTITADLSLTSTQSTIAAPSRSDLYAPQPPFPSLATAGNDQVAYDRAWHVVTARIALPSSATADDSFGTLPPDSQLHPASQQFVGSDQDFYDALAFVVHAPSLLPRATHTEDIIAWHAQQVRAHFAQHVIPLLSGCVDDAGNDSGGDDDLEAERGDGHLPSKRKSNHYERHMVMVMSSIRTLEAALRLYFYGLSLLVRGFGRLVDGSASEQAAAEAELLATRFRRDIHALVGNSASEELMASVRIVLVRLCSTILGIQPADSQGNQSTSPPRPSPPTEEDLRALAARQRLHELVEQLHNVGLAGERFQVLFGLIMDSMMSKFVTGAYAGVWTLSTSNSRSFSAATNTISRRANSSSSLTSPCILSLGDWIENHFARLSFEVLSRVSPDPSSSPVTLSDVKTYQSLALGRLAALRIAELFDIVLAWPQSRGALDDLRATITTTARRLQLTSSFSRTLQTRLLHPGCSTLEILRTYIAIIRTFHALDPSKVLLSHIEPSLQLYLCQREDAVRIVVTGLLSSLDEIKAAWQAKETAERQRRGKTPRGTEADPGPFMTPALPRRGNLKTPVSTRTRRDSTPDPVVKDLLDTPIKDSGDGAMPLPSNKLVELALLLNDPAQTRRAAPEDEELDWNDMSWVPDPIDAGANYKRPKSEDVIGTLISALGSEDTFIKEFSSVVAGRLLGEPARFDQELRVLDLLKRRFGEAALQNCDVMIRDMQDSRRVDAAIKRQREKVTGGARAAETPLRTPTANKGIETEGAEAQYQARILSRLFWPDLEREHFLLPTPIVEYQRWYEQGYEALKSKRKLTWLNQLGQARVEVELEDRTVTVDCSTVEATVIYAFQDPDGATGGGDGGPARRTVDELYNNLQLDEDLIGEALTFWTGKGVLKRVAVGTFVVVESLASSAGGAAGNAGGDAETAATTSSGEGDAEAEDSGAVSPRKQDGGSGLSAKEMERRAMYWQYVKGMLTNASASMPLAQVSMMMKMLVPDGFPWSGEELQEFLGEKVTAGDLEVVGGKYRLSMCWYTEVQEICKSCKAVLRTYGSDERTCW
ncbi:Cullin family-domain-containing protein [Cercophora newfieldiana]|uniref:Anaphase-promoting complex subunit 2 n=1 Tax=Cercophora newfieldiana TaxID=92897 RepID=A0AA40D030_9PEZI|nr:Cullin family-domain-containing protein [Cercophora newfieldiana]